MIARHHRISRLVASTVTAAALAAPGIATAGTGDGSAGTSPAEPTSPTLRNDVAHHGGRSSAEPASTTLQNDIAHHGTQGRLPASNAAQAPSAPAAVVVRVEGGFDWASAGVGAAGGFGLVLVAGAAASGLRRRHGVDPARV